MVYMPIVDGEYVYEQESHDTVKNRSSTSNSSTDEVKAQANTTYPNMEKSQPIANEPGGGFGIAAARGDISTGQSHHHRDASEDAIFKRLRQSPELISILEAIVDDVIGPGASFQYMGRTDSGANGERSLQEARHFWEQNAETFADALRDQLVVGDMYLYKRQRSEAQVQDAAEDVIRSNYKFNFEGMEEYAAKEVVDQMKADTDMFNIMELRHVPAITVEHIINKHGDITAFKQKVGSHRIELPGDQIMHNQFMGVNGKTYGFTPFLSLFTELDMLANAKNHNAQIFENAGVVNKIFKMPDEGPGEQNFEMVKQTVAKYRELRNKHRDLVLTGNIEIEDMNSIGDTMEFQQLAEYITNVLIMAWGVPPTRIGTDVGGESRAAQLSHEGYFKRIERLQRKYQAFLNEELFMPVFNCRMEFNSTNTKAEIREADRDLRKLDVAQRHAALGLWDMDKVAEYLDINRNQLPEDFSNEEFRERAMEVAGLQDEFLDDETVNEDTAETAERMDRREGQTDDEEEEEGF